MSAVRSPDPMIRDAAARLLGEIGPATQEAAGRGEWAAAEWAAVESSGFTEILVDAGDAVAWCDAWAVLHALGEYAVSLPVAETMLAARFLTLAGIERGDGPLALVDGSRLQLTGPPGSGVLHGVARRVPWATRCPSWVVAVPASDGVAVVRTEAGTPGVRIEPGVNAAGEPSGTLRFEGVRAMPCKVTGLRSDAARVLGAAARAAAIAGALQSALDLSVRHAMERSQFGKPIGRFQAVQQQLAVAAGDVAAATIAGRVALSDAAAMPRWFDVAVAKVRADAAANRVAAIAHQVHGAMGFTREHPLHAFTTRMLAWTRDFGTAREWAEALGAAAVADGSGRLWAGVTARSLEEAR